MGSKEWYSHEACEARRILPNCSFLGNNEFRAVSLSEVLSSVIPVAQALTHALTMVSDTYHSCIRPPSETQRNNPCAFAVSAHPRSPISLVNLVELLPRQDGRFLQAGANMHLILIPTPWVQTLK